MWHLGHDSLLAPGRLLHLGQVPFGSQLEVLVPLGPLVRITTTTPTTRYATMVIPSYEVSAASGALVPEGS